MDEVTEPRRMIIDVGPLTRSIRRVVPALVSAFWDYPETRHLLPGERARRRVLPRYLASDARDAARHGTLLAAHGGNKPVGAAAWLPPGAYPISGWRQAVQAIRLAPIAPWGARALAEALRGQAANRSHHVDLPPHYWLRAIGVHPASQGLGVGRRLMAPVLARADEEGRGCFLFTATEANVGWYGSLGFEVRSTFHPTPRWPRVWAMWRESSGVVGGL